MIHFDTNFLILSLIPGTPQHGHRQAWLAAGEPLNISTVAWGEFLCGPLTAEQARMADILFPGPEPLFAADAVRAAELFNQTGRRRGSLADCMIAAVAIRAGAALATENLSDFRPFVPFGLQMFIPP